MSLIIFYSTSVTRFGEILPLWQNFDSLLQCFVGLFIIWHNFDPTLNKIIRQYIVAVIGQILNKLSSHLVTLAHVQAPQMIFRACSIKHFYEQIYGQNLAVSTNL